MLKERIFDLDQKLDKVIGLPANVNVMNPLSFAIKRSSNERDASLGTWEISLLMDLAPKGSMQDLLETVNTTNLDCFRAWALQLLEGLMFYHRHGIVHARVHIRNILLVKADTGNTTVKLSDASYQHAIHALEHRLDVDYSSAASTEWVPPEVMNSGGTQPMAASDIWDLGTCFLQMLFGLGVQSLHPSPKELLQELELSQSAEELLEKMFKTDHKRRPSAFELLPSAFLRNNDPLEQLPSLQSSFKPPAALKTSPSTSKRRRRESANTPVTSRYHDDFVEAGRLGRGGYGEVVRARNKLDGRFYAIKVIKSRSATALNDVLSEIMLLSQLNHQNVVRYYNAWLEDNGNSSEARIRSVSSSSDISTEDSSESGDDVFERHQSGLDFMSESGPDIVFEDDSDEEEPQARISSANGQHATPETEEDQHGNTDSPEPGSRKTRSNSFIPSSKSTLYIQMEYCEKKVSVPVSLDRLPRHDEQRSYLSSK